MKSLSKCKKMILMMLIISASCLSGEVYSQEAVVLDLNAAIEIAMSENPTVKVADKEIQRKKYAKKEQIAGLFPTLSANGSYSRALKKQVMAMEMNGMTTEIEVGQDNTWSGGFSLALPVVAPTLWKTIQLSELDVTLSLESARASRISLVNEMKKAYYTLLLAQDSYEVLKISYNNSEMNARNITDKYNQGLASEFDKLRADVQVKNQKPQLVSTANAVKLADMQLKVLMGVDVHQEITFTGNLADFEPEMFADLLSLKSDTSLVNNSDLKQLDIQAQQLAKTRALNRAMYLPSLSLGANYDWVSMNNDFKMGQYRWNPYSAIGITLSIPIVDAAKIFKNKQNKIDIENIGIQRENLLRNLELSVNNFLNNIETAVEEVGSNKESIVQAEKAYDISLKRFDVGSATLLELNDAEVALTQSRLSYNQSIFNYLSARADLEKTMGKHINKQ